MQLPQPRGPISEHLFAYLRQPGSVGLATSATTRPAKVLDDDDLQVALWSCYELHYRGFDGVADELEWDPAVLAFRAAIEATFVSALREIARIPSGSGPVPERLKELVDDADGQSALRRAP